MNSKTNLNVNQIMKWLEEERKSYSMLLEVMERQKVAALEGDEGNLLQVIHEKERILGNLREIDRKIKGGVEVLGQEEHSALIKRSHTIREEFESMLSQILVLETFCEDLLAKQKSSLLVQMKTTKHGRLVLKGYGSASFQRSRFSRNA